MTNYKTLLACTVTAFLVIMEIYLFLSPDPLSSRIGFAVISAGVPGLVLSPVARRWSISQTVIGYVVIFTVVQVLIAVW